MSWFTDQYVEWCDDTTGEENFGTYYYGDGLLNEDEDMYVSYDAGQDSVIYPPTPIKVRPPSGPPPVRPPSAPSVNPPSAPRIRRPKNPTPNYDPET